MITRDHLTRWLRTAPDLPWREAKTYRKRAPHTYVVRDKGLDTPRFEEAIRVIRTFGQPGRFYNSTQIYLIPGDGWRYWTMPGPLAGHGVINRAPENVTYGPQDAPSTDPGHDSPWDGICTYFDDWFPPDPAEDEQVSRLFARTFGAYAPTMLAHAPRTGRILGTGVTSPALTTVVEDSRGMLNELVERYPKVAHVVPARHAEGTYEAVVAPFGSGSYLTNDDVRRLTGQATALVLVMLYADPPAHLPEPEGNVDFPGFTTYRMGRYHALVKEV